MNKEQVRQKILDLGIIPVVRASSGQQAVHAAEAVCAGGIPIVELTMTVPGAINVISQLVKSMGKEVLIGAGTVLDAQVAQRCLDAGAQFLVSPGFDLATVQLAKHAGLLIIAGALTPTEVIAAWKAGSDLVKIFPCGSMGGAKYIKSLKAPLPQIPMVPTGGVSLETAADYFLAGADALGVGSDLISPATLKSGEDGRITEIARQYMLIAHQCKELLLVR